MPRRRKRDANLHPTRQCWRSLSTKFDRQIRYKNRRTKQTYTHMLFILTYFHLYWKIIILQDIYTNTVENVTKICFSTKRRRETRREAHLPDESGLKIDAWEVQAHVATDHAKAVTGRRYPGAGAAAPLAAPPCLPFHVASPGGAFMMVACGIWWNIL